MLYFKQPYAYEHKVLDIVTSLLKGVFSFSVNFFTTFSAFVVTIQLY